MNGKTRKPAGHLLCALIMIPSLFLWACVAPETTRDENALETPVLETIALTPEGDSSVITVTCSGETTFSPFFTLPSPPRICLDIKGIPSSEFPNAVRGESGPVREVTVQDRDSGYTGMVIYLREKEKACTVIAEGAVIRIIIGSPDAAEKADIRDADPASKISPFPQILNVELSEPKKHRTRLTIVSEKELPYKSRLDDKTLFLDFKDSAISRSLIKKIAAKSFIGAVERMEVVHPEGGRDVSLIITLKELAPYHISRNGTALYVDFASFPKRLVRVSAPPLRKASAPAKKPSALAEKVAAPVKNKPPKVPSKPPATKSNTGKNLKSEAVIYEATSQQYAGGRMSFDFVDTDIRNILRLISEVADINIVWGADVAGKISMTLNDVPWDQAIEMILRPNGLTYQIENDVLWVVPKSKLVDMQIAEKSRKNALMAAKRLQGIFEAKIIEFITIRNRKASDIYRMLMGDPTADPPIMGILDIEGGESEEKEEGEEEEGKKTKIVALDLYLSYDAGTNMIIANGVRAKVDKVKEFISMLDIAEKQVMIEARVVEAVIGFSRDLGVQWSSLDGNSPGFQRDWYNTGSNSDGSAQFSTNSPASWEPNIGMAIGWLTGGGLGSIALDASLALAEEDQKVDIISAPRVMTVNGGEAEVARGEVKYFPIRTLDTISYEQIPALLSLKVSPTVSSDNSHVTMVVEVTDNKSLDAKVTFTPDGGEETSPPGRTEKKITSTLIVKTGETVVIGGIYQKDERTADSGVPWVKDLPFIGWLFKAERKQRGQIELLIFLTPTVINSEGRGI